jgi:hypothetical protein
LNWIIRQILISLFVRALILLFTGIRAAMARGGVGRRLGVVGVVLPASMGASASAPRCGPLFDDDCESASCRKRGALRRE